MTEIPANAFTAHNIRLDDGQTTMPDIHWTIDQHPVFGATRRVLQLLYPSGLNGHSIADLGCLEGGYAIEFARLGMISTGIEVRESNIRNCLYAKQRVNLPTLSFIKDDVMNITAHGPFDVIFANGLLYHLDRPKSFLINAASVCRKALILHTHVSLRAETPSRHTHSLSELERHEGLLGRWYDEHAGNQLTDEQREALKWHSWQNSRSFWVEKAELLQTLIEVGFDLIFEQFDWLGDIRHATAEGGVYAAEDRVMLVALKSHNNPNLG